jgi:hypothetical protein
MSRVMPSRGFFRLSFSSKYSILPDEKPPEIVLWKQLD